MRTIDDLIVYTDLNEIYNYIDSTDFDFVSKPRSKKAYLNEFMTFDIETTTESETIGYPYTYQFTIGNQSAMVRTFADFANVLHRIINKYGLCEDFRIIIYVHNLGYEAFYLWQLLNKEFHLKEYLTPKSRKPLTIVYTEGLEFRDSLKLFQKSLASATKNCKHSKLQGDLDYNIIRYPDSNLNDKEFRYCIYDVVGLREAIIMLFKDHGYNTATVPLTNTAIVRESVLKSISHDAEYRQCKNKTKPDKLQLEILIRTMGGGDTHGSRFLAGKTINNCNMVDIKSAHPSQMLLKKYPCGTLTTYVNGMSWDEYNTISSDFAVWMYVDFVELAVQPQCSNPVISISKCENVESETEDVNDLILDNGRVIYAYKCSVMMDSNDFSRIQRSYTWEDAKIVCAVTSKLRYLPLSFREPIKNYFANKESIVNKNDFVYMFSKICVNTIYGACAQKPARDSYTAIISDNGVEYDHTNWIDVLHNMNDAEFKRVIENQKAFPFVWGSWTASLTRLQLFDMQEKIGWHNIIYWDTDSIYYRGEKAECIKLFNIEKIIEVKERGAIVKNYKNEDVYIGTFEDDYQSKTYGIEKFRFLHAKCYAYIVDGELKTTIAGVGKKEGLNALKDIENLKDGFYISNAGGKKIKYCSMPIRTIKRGEMEFPIASHIVMADRDYMISDNRKMIIENIEQEVIV